MAQLVKTVGPTAIASVKTCSGVAIASVKTILGVDNTSSGPTLVISDDFTYSNGDIQTQSGGTWTIVLAAGGININSNRYTGNHTDYSIAYHSTAINANQRAEATIVVVGASSYAGVAVRVQASADSYFTYFNNGSIYLEQRSGATNTILMSDVAASFSNGNRIALEANGAGTSTRLKVQVDTGSGWVDKWTDVNPGGDIDGGSAGICTYANTATTLGDTFRAYNL